jgi:hypothetical protein
VPELSEWMWAQLRVEFSEWPRKLSSLTWKVDWIQASLLILKVLLLVLLQVSPAPQRVWLNSPSACDGDVWRAQDCQ